MGKIKFGARIPTSGPVSKREWLIESTLEAEALGYNMVIDTDHIHNSFERHKHYPVAMGSFRDPANTLEPNQFETISTYAFLAGKTSKIQFMTGVMPILLRDPIVLAKEAATLDALSGGRFILGVGVSNVSDRGEWRTMGKPFPSYAERYRMLVEYVEAMKAIWTQPTASYHGRYVNFDGLTIYPKPARKPHLPIWAGTGSLCRENLRPRDHPAVRFTLEHSDGWLGGLLKTRKALRTLIQDFNDAASQEGRSVAGFEWCYALRLSLGETEEDAKRNAAWIVDDQPHMAQYAGYMWKLGEASRASVQGASVGMTSKILKAVEEAVDAGATAFDLWFMYPRFEDFRKQLRLFAKEIIPSFN